MSNPLNMEALASKIRKSFKNDDKKAKTITTGNEMTTPTKPEDFVVLPEELGWKEIAGILGLPFGHMVMISGKPDSGKTSFVIQAIKAAQSQGVVPILADTEKKTTKGRLEDWGVDPDNLGRVQPNYLEEMFDGIDKWWNAIKDANPTARILIIIDSLGNTPAYKEVELDVEDTMQLGLAAKVIKRGLRRIKPRIEAENVAILVINQTYNNLGSPGRSNSGGNAPDFYSSLTYQTARKSWIEKTKGGKVFRAGAKVVWSLYKNHFLEENTPFHKKVEFDITGEGMKVILPDKKKDKQNDPETK